MKMAVTTVFLAASANLAAADISGHYKMEGVDTKGTVYSGSADIKMSTESDCRITYSDPFEGICMVNGTTFVVAYDLHHKLGLAIYEIASDGVLKGKFIDNFHGGGVGHETLTPAP